MKFSLSLTFTLYAAFSMAQNNTGVDILENDKENYTNVADSIIKEELGVFSIKRAEIMSGDRTAGKDILKEIPVYHCSDTSMYFTKSDFFSSHMGVSLVFSGTQPKLKLAKVVVSFDHWNLSVPGTALIDITNPMLCQQATKKGRFTTSGCGVYRSKDKRRIYIHMVNEEEKNRFEVTWIIQNNKYYGRVIDRLK